MKRRNILGKFTPRNSYKLLNPSISVIYRSLWERKVMLYCDRSDSVISWSSEMISIPYFNPIDQKYHTYFPDFFIRFYNKLDIPVAKIIEVKPVSQINWLVNRAKFKAAREYCLAYNFEFQVLTEMDIKP